MLSDKHNFFHSDYYDRYKNKALQPTVMSAYNKLAHDYGIAPNNKISINGYGDLGLSYAFSHATPNNTLPIFWYSSNKWTPLLDR
jgi:hypothetical protein